MRDYGKVYTRFWLSDDMRGLSEDGRTLALYLMTCPHGNMLGCFRLPTSYAADDMQWESERVSKGFVELLQRRFAYRCESTSWVLIRQYLKWNQFENPNVAKAAAKLFDALSCPANLKALIISGLRDFAPYFDRNKIVEFESTAGPFANPFGLSTKTRTRARASTRALAKPEPEPKTHVEQRDAPPVRDPAPKVFAFWQEVMSSPNSKLDARRITTIRKAIEMGYTPRQLCEAVRGCAMSPFNMGQNDRRTKYNGIDLIFRSADQIDRFIELASGQATDGSDETIEQRNVRILAELSGAMQGGAANTIEMEA